MILQIERKNRRTYIDGITSLNVYHNGKGREDVDTKKLFFYPFDKDAEVPKDKKLRIFSCYDEDTNKHWLFETDCVCFLLNNNGKTIARYADNTLT